MIAKRAIEYAGLAVDTLYAMFVLYVLAKAWLNRRTIPSYYRFVALSVFFLAAATSCIISTLGKSTPMLALGLIGAATLVSLSWPALHANVASTYSWAQIQAVELIAEEPVTQRGLYVLVAQITGIKGSFRTSDELAQNLVDHGIIGATQVAYLNRLVMTYHALDADLNSIHGVHKMCSYETSVQSQPTRPEIKNSCALCLDESAKYTKVSNQRFRPLFRG